MDPVLDPPLLRKFGKAENRTRISGSVRELLPLDHRGGRRFDSNTQNYAEKIYSFYYNNRNTRISWVFYRRKKNLITKLKGLKGTCLE
jgi:hypothetical protein